jgi:hypothetical protein
LQRWQAGGEITADKRAAANRPAPINKLTEQERQSIIAVCNTEEFASLPPSQIVPILADRGEYIASESSFYRVLKAEDMLHHRGKAKVRKANNKPTSYTAAKANEVWSLGHKLFTDKGHWAPLLSLYDRRYIQSKNCWLGSAYQ